MPYLLIPGSYRIVGAAPDGDSIKFYPNRPGRWDDLEWRARQHRVRHNKAGGAQLRLDGIDTLETHYTPRVEGAVVEHQPWLYARRAADELAEFFGFRHVRRGDNERVTAAEPPEAPGYILTKFVDAYGRAVAFAFRGPPPERDGGEVYLEEALLRQSANHHMLAQGLAYPTYYAGLYPELRSALTQAAREAKADGRGLWPQDRSTKGFEIRSHTTLSQNAVILPKLFRRLTDYLALEGGLSLGGLSDYLRDRDDRLVVLNKGQTTGLHHIVEVKGRRVRMSEPADNLMFLEK